MLQIGIMRTTGNAVVRTLEEASRTAWQNWRSHLEAGTSDTAEALRAFDDAQLAGTAWLDEVTRRAALLARAA
jgi:hypothetical protein